MTDKLKNIPPSKDWKFRISVERDIRLTVERSGDKSSMFCFGKSEHGLLASDLIFSVDADIQTLYIPRQILWKLHASTKQNDEFCVSEIVKVEFHEASNTYYKSLVGSFQLLTHLSIRWVGNLDLNGW